MVKQVLKLFMVAIVGNVSRNGPTIEVHRRNQPNKSKLVLYVSAITFTLKQLYVSNKRNTSVTKVGVVYVDVVHVSRYLKEELA